MYTAVHDMIWQENTWNDASRKHIEPLYHPALKYQNLTNSTTKPRHLSKEPYCSLLMRIRGQSPAAVATQLITIFKMRRPRKQPHQRLNRPRKEKNRLRRAHFSSPPRKVPKLMGAAFSGFRRVPKSRRRRQAT